MLISYRAVNGVVFLLIHSDSAVKLDTLEWTTKIARAEAQGVKSLPILGADGIPLGFA